MAQPVSGKKVLAAVVLAVSLFVLLKGGGGGKIPATAEEIPSRERVVTITHGGEVDLSRHLGEKGRWTVVEFAADW